MNPNTKVVDGVIVTTCEYPPPSEEWTENYQEMGGDEYWGEGGEVSEVLESRGLSGNIRPLFALDAESGSPYTLFELGGTFHFFTPADDSVERIQYPKELAEILGTIADPDPGLDGIHTATV
ncbi:hypothetical protein FDENT_5491 [Fusarium denticulatum]|uniref:Uncharacterized protein n=1 Tax=Fusarium denticulatum TaxID=48507 RepID=A0A8H5X4N4_9HYPO|nr:hypothetical protein FDENT_5491 [Fusarium denticulatum]